MNMEEVKAIMRERWKPFPAQDKLTPANKAIQFPSVFGYNMQGSPVDVGRAVQGSLCLVSMSWGAVGSVCRIPSRCFTSMVQ
jgi:hypothetical protein